MKYLFLFVAVATFGLITACSSDDNGGGEKGTSELKVTINGVEKTFNTFNINETKGGNWKELEITATIDYQVDEIISFKVLEINGNSATKVMDFLYTRNGVEFEEGGENSFFSSLVETSKNGKLKGSFIGLLRSYTVSDTIELSDGTFEVYY